jgi:hypothetical protein
MIGIGCLVIILPVTGITFAGEAGIGATDMTKVTVIYCMSCREGEECMIQFRSNPVPAETIDGMTFYAIGGVTRLYMIRFGSSIVIGLVTINTRHSHGLKSKQRS